MRLAIFALAMALQAQMELAAAEECCTQVMIIPQEGVDVNRYSSLPSDQQAFISEFIITGNNTEMDAPNYQAGDFCITWEKHPSWPTQSLEGWVVRDCVSGSRIAEAFVRNPVSKCLENANCFYFIDFKTVCIDSVCGAAPSDTTKVVTTEPEAPTTQEHVRTTKDKEVPVAPFTTTEAPTTQEHLETTLKPCEPCRDVLEGDLAGYYELQSEDDPRCDDGCSYTNQHSQEFCFRPGGFETKLECHDPQ